MVAHLRRGEIIIYPTDTLYAIGCCALDGAAVSRLRAAKGRESGKPLPVIAADLAQARSLAASWPETAERLAAAFWPGPLTLVLKAARSLPSELLSGLDTIAVRVPASPLARALAQGAGPLVSTSANPAGEPVSVTVEQTLEAFPGATIALDMGPLSGAPSTILAIDGEDGGCRLLRPGRIPYAEIVEVLARSRPA